jgi:hypothetical protein
VTSNLKIVQTLAINIITTIAVPIKNYVLLTLNWSYDNSQLPHLYHNHIYYLTIFHTILVEMFLIYLHIKFHIPSSNGRTVIAIITSKWRFHIAAMLCYILQTKLKWMAQDSAVSVISMPWAANSVISFQRETNDFHLYPKCPGQWWGYQASYSMATRGSFPRGKVMGIKLTTRLHPVLTLWMSGSIPLPHSFHTSIARTSTISPLPNVAPISYINVCYAVIINCRKLKAYGWLDLQKYNMKACNATNWNS